MDLSRYADLFLTESREHLSAINHALLEFERTAGAAEPVEAIFRAVHTVKGMSATMGYTAVAELSHEMETLLDLVRRGERIVTGEVSDALFHATDALETAIELSVAGRPEEADTASEIGRLRSLMAGLALTTAASGKPASGELTIGARGAGAPAGWSVALPPGDGRAVFVRLSPSAPLRGVRAFLVVQKLGTLGEIRDTAPSISALQAEEFDLEFAVRVATQADESAIERAARQAGDVDAVAVDLQGAGVGWRPAAATPLSAPAVAAGLAAATVPAQMRAQRHVRMDLRRLDNLMNLIGELVITRGRLQQLAAGIQDSALDDSVTQASRLISDLQDEIMSSRMVQVGQVFDRFPRLVRDAARVLEKQVDFTVQGKDIELDRSMLDEIGDPIVHLLRNAVDHGIETPAERRAAGKPEVGHLGLSASRERSAVVIRVADDGRGIDRDRVLARAKAAELVETTKSDLSDDELLRLISRSGFSTAERVTDLSGRGVGIDAVQTRLRSLGGSVEIRSAPGQGTTVTLRLPLTLAILRALLTRVGNETYALPMTLVNETVELTLDTLRTVKGKDVLILRDDVIPLHHLRDLVRLPRGATPERVGMGQQQVVVLEQAERRAGLVVDELTGQQEIVVKQFDVVRDGLSLFSGATILGDGAPALIVDVATLL